MTARVGVSLQRALAAAASTLLCWSVAAAQPVVTEPALKAAFLFNFAKFAEWPAAGAPAGPLTICVLGDTALADALVATLKGRRIDDREVVAVRVEARGVHACHVLYITGLDRKLSQQIVDELNGAPVLTVSDRDRFAEGGGIVNLFVEDGHIRFAINVEAAQRGHLQISSRLLALATLVKDGHVAP